METVTTLVAGVSASLILQQFVYTGPRPVSYRVCTLFGKALHSKKYESSDDRLNLAGPAALQNDFGRGGVSIVASARGSRVEPNYDEEIIRFAEAAHAAFPEIPLLGFDIVRETPSGKLFVLEANALGYVWYFHAQQTADFGFSAEEQVRRGAQGSLSPGPKKRNSMPVEPPGHDRPGASSFLAMHRDHVV